MDWTHLVVPCVSYFLALSCCFGRFLFDYFEQKEWIPWLLMVLWSSKAIGHFWISISVTRRWVKSFGNFSARRTGQTVFRWLKAVTRNQQPTVASLSLLAILSILCLSYAATIYYRVEIVHNEWCADCSQFELHFLYTAGIAYGIFVLMEALFLMYYLPQGKKEFLKEISTNDAKESLQRNLVCLTGATSFLLMYDFSWIVTVIGHYHIENFRQFVPSLHVTHIGTVLFDVLAFVGIHEIYTRLKHNEEMEGGETRPCVHNFTPYVNLLTRWHKECTHVFTVCAVIRTIVNIGTGKESFFIDGLDYVLAILVWFFGFLSMGGISKSVIFSMFFILSSMALAIAVMFDQIFEAYNLWLKDRAAVWLLGGSGVLGCFGFCYASLFVVEGLIMIWLYSFNGHISLQLKSKVAESDILLLMNSSWWYCLYSLLFLCDLPSEDMTTVFARILGPPLYHFLMSLCYFDLHQKKFGLKNKKIYHLQPDILELFNFEKKTLVKFSLLIVPEILRFLIPAVKHILPNIIRIYYLIICFYWLYVIMKVLKGKKMIVCCFSKICEIVRKSEWKEYPEQVGGGISFLLLLLAALIGIGCRAYHSYATWGRDDGNSFIAAGLLIVLVPMHCLSIISQSLLLCGAAIAYDTAGKLLENRVITNFVESLQILVHINLALLTDHVIYTTSAMYVKTGLPFFFQCVLLLFHIISLMLIRYVSGKLKCEIAEESQLGTSDENTPQQFHDNAFNREVVDSFQNTWRSVAFFADKWTEILFQYALVVGIFRLLIKKSIVITLVFRTIVVIIMALVNSQVSWYLTRQLSKDIFSKAIFQKPASTLLIALGGCIGLCEIYLVYTNQLPATGFVESFSLIIVIFSNFTFIIHEVILLIFLLNVNVRDVNFQSVNLTVARKANHHYAAFSILSSALSLKSTGLELNWELIGQVAASMIVPLMVLLALESFMNALEGSSAEPQEEQYHLCSDDTPVRCVSQSSGDKSATVTENTSLFQEIQN